MEICFIWHLMLMLNYIYKFENDVFWNKSLIKFLLCIIGVIFSNEKLRMTASLSASVPSLFNFLSNQNGNEKIVSQRRTAVEVPLEINKNWGKMVGRACLLKWGWKILNWCYSDYNAFIAKSNLQLESWHIFAKFHKYWPTRSKDILLVAYFIPTLYRK